MKIERLNKENLESYFAYLKKAMAVEPDMMTAEKVDESGIKERMIDPFYMNTTSLLAFVEDIVAGRIEYHFYGCLQDGYRMAYVDWINNLPEYRHHGITQALFEEFEKDCREKEIDQYYLIRAVNDDVEKFYNSFETASLSYTPFAQDAVRMGNACLQICALK